MRSTRFGLVRCAGLLLVVAACRQGATDPDTGLRLSVFVPPEDMTLAQEMYSGMARRERLAVRAASEWPAVWARIHGAQQPPPDIVQPDFGEEMAVVAAMGRKSTGGFTIVIDSVTRHERGSMVYLTETSPGRNCVLTQGETAPVHAVRAPRSDGTIWWRERSVVENC